MKLDQICKAYDGQLRGDPNQLITALGTIDNAKPGDLVYAESDKYLQQVIDSKATAILVPIGFPEVAGKNLIELKQPRKVFNLIMETVERKPEYTGIHNLAVISDTVTLGDNVSIAACAVIEADVKLGNDVFIGAGCYIGEGVTIADNTRISPNVTLLAFVSVGADCIIHSGTVIGGDGFGYSWEQDHHHKIPQLGTVSIGDNVEIGCNVCIDRATLGATVISEGCKIDNLVHIAHNIQIGKHVVLAGQVGIAGSTTIGDYAVLAGTVGVSDHLTIGKGAVLAAGSGVLKNIADGEKVLGYPAKPIAQCLKEYSAISRLPALLKQNRQQQKMLEALMLRVEQLELKS